MVINLKRIRWSGSPDRYPYNCRIEIGGSLREVEILKDWITERNIKCTIVGHAVYTTEKYASMIVLQWSQ